MFFLILFFYVLLKALPPVCMKYHSTARDENRVANIARGEA